MFNFFTSFAANTHFEKHRLELTTKTLDAPNEHSLKYLINTFSSNDAETKAQIAYATIIKKLLTSDSKNNWLYILKNLLILDKVVEQNLFYEEISLQAISTIDNFAETEDKNMAFDSQRMIKRWWKLLKQKSLVLKTGRHIFCHKRSQRNDYLSKLNLQQILQQIQSIEHFFALILQLVEHVSGSRMMEQNPQIRQKILKARLQFSKSKLLEYIYLQILNKLMLYYSCELLCSNSILVMLSKSGMNFQISDIKRLKKAMAKFNQNARWIVMFVEQRKHIKGFEEINYKELNPFENANVQKILDEIIDHRQKENQEQGSNKVSLDYYASAKQNRMKVEMRPLTSSALLPRIAQRKEQESSDARKDTFYDWNNSYSSEFPQKEVMTVDLILSMKEGSEEEDFIYKQQLKESRFFSSKEMNLSEFKVSERIKLRQSTFCPHIKFSNIYSAPSFKWNN